MSSTHYYAISYIDGGYERVSRFEDMVACKFGNKKIKFIREYKLTEKGWIIKEL